MSARLAIVTATLDLTRATFCLRSWTDHVALPVDLYVVEQGAEQRDWEVFSIDAAKRHRLIGYRSREILGVVPAFAIGVQKALDEGAQIIASLHDDLEILENGWDETVVRLFQACPRAGLCGFGGGKGLGSDDLYKVPYNPMQLARQRFLSNMRDAEAHGERCEVATPVACLDGFSQIGRREFWEGKTAPGPGYTALPLDANLFRRMQAWGVTHHFYDSMLGCFAKRLGWQVWMLPVRCHHHGGLTAVGDARYTQWANDQRLGGRDGQVTASGDQQFWVEAHRIGYDQFKDVLPIRT